MTMATPDADQAILDSLDWRPGCDVDGCDNIAGWLATMRCCGATEIGCTLCRNETLTWAAKRKMVKCSRCCAVGAPDDLAAWTRL